MVLRLAIQRQYGGALARREILQQNFASVREPDRIAVPIDFQTLLDEGHRCYAIPRPDSFAGLGACSPAAELGNEFAVDNWNQYSPQQRDLIRTLMTGLLRPSLDYTLRRLKLID